MSRVFKVSDSIKVDGEKYKLEIKDKNRDRVIDKNDEIKFIKPDGTAKNVSRLWPKGVEISAKDKRGLPKYLSTSKDLLRKLTSDLRKKVAAEKEVDRKLQGRVNGFLKKLPTSDPSRSILVKGERSSDSYKLSVNKGYLIRNEEGFLIDKKTAQNLIQSVKRAGPESGFIVVYRRGPRRKRRIGNKTRMMSGSIEQAWIVRVADIRTNTRNADTIINRLNDNLNYRKFMN